MAEALCLITTSLCNLLGFLSHISPSHLLVEGTGWTGREGRTRKEEGDCGEAGAARKNDDGQIPEGHGASVRTTKLPTGMPFHCRCLRRQEDI